MAFCFLLLSWYRFCVHFFSFFTFFTSGVEILGSALVRGYAYINI